jgi:plasmid stabilization system protein ParE
MPRIVYSARASDDLIRLFNFLADKDIPTAQRAMSQVRDSLAILTRMPKIGRPVEEGFRELIIDFGSSGYLALYDFDEIQDAVTVHAVRHQKENDYPSTAF